jgi:hypothetical protein
MKLLYTDIVTVKIELDKIIKRTTESPIPGRVAIKFARLLKDLEPLYLDFEKQRSSLLQKFGKPDPNNSDLVIIESQHKDTFNREMSEILSVEIEFNPSVFLTEEDFDVVNIDVMEAIALLPFIKNS